MFEFLVNLIINAAILMLVAHIVKGFQIQGWGPAIFTALALSVINSTIRYVVLLLTLPLTILTLGLFLFVVNALMLWLATAIVPGAKVEKFGTALLASLLLTFFNFLVAWAL
ncbi:phage holin family protein [Planctomicrobium sp. SH668]|uniref:phage holin family protein n=1 Tax=Planctomicrobium sp. SH668 TaxID=3448126 RepID=UPI003F5AF662